MAESLERKYAPPDNPEVEKQKESQKESERYLKLAKEKPHSLSEEIKKNPKTEPLLRKLLGDNDYERIRDLNPMKLSEDMGIAKMQKEIYSFVDINPETDKNPTKEKFLKGLIDSIIVENAELAMKIIETKGKILLDMVDQILSWEGLSQIAEGLKTSVMGIFSGDAYKTGKSAGELGLITIGSGAGGFLLKKAGKTAMKLGEGVAVRAGEKTVLSQTLTLGGKGVEISGRIVQAPYNGVKAVGGAMKDGVKAVAEKTGISEAVKTASEPLRKVVSETSEKLSPHVKKIIDTTKQRAKETLALLATPILVGSKDGTEGMGKLRGQIGAIGDDVNTVKPFDKSEGKPIMEDMKMEEPKSPEPKIEKKELGFDIANNPVYKENPFLEKYADVLGNLKPSDVISDIGTQGFIVKPEKLQGVVAKIERPNAVDKIINEFNLHNEAYDIWRKGRKKGLIPKKVHIPKVEMPKGVDNGIMLIEQVQGQSLHTKSLIEDAYKIRKDAQPLTQEEKELVSGFTDGEVKKFIMEKYSISSDDAFRVIELYSSDHLGPYLHDRMRPTFKTDLSKALSYLQNQVPGINHIDIHPGNIMVTNDKEIYIIDWGRAKITNVPTSINP